MALVSGVVAVGAVFCLSVCLFVVCFCYLFTICSLFVRSLLLSVCCLLLVASCLSVMLFTFVICSFVRYLFVVRSLSTVGLLFACCMSAAVDRKIKFSATIYAFAEVFSPHVYVAFMCVPRQYSCLRPSGRCRAKRPFSTTFSNSL